MAAAEAALVHAWAALDGGLHKEAAAQQAGGAAEAAAEQPLFLRRFRAAWVYCMMGTAGVSLLERQRRYSEAVERLQLLLGERRRACLDASCDPASGAHPRPPLGSDFIAPAPLLFCRRVVLPVPAWGVVGSAEHQPGAPGAAQLRAGGGGGGAGGRVAGPGGPPGAAAQGPAPRYGQGSGGEAPEERLTRSRVLSLRGFGLRFLLDSNPYKDAQLWPPAAPSTPAPTCRQAAAAVEAAGVGGDGPV